MAQFQHSYTEAGKLWESKESGRVTMKRTVVMGKVSKMCRIHGLVFLFVCLAAMDGCQFNMPADAAPVEGQNAAAPQTQTEPSLIIENETDLPMTHPHIAYEVRFHMRRGGSGLHWRVEKGTLPPGLKLEEDGLLHGAAERTGEFQFTVSARDRGNPEAGVQKEFILRVISALTINWKNPAHVNGGRIEGTVNVTNTTADDMDLTFVVMAVAPNGRATAIGYQHFLLRRGTVDKELPFGENLPSGGYAVHVDAVGEVAPRNLIYRDQLQTPAPLQVTVGP